jgi:tetratricopeptide (TPR) repeat protein
MNTNKQIKEGQLQKNAPAAPQNTIAVLPSKIVNAEKSDHTFLDLADSIITNLSLIKQIIVRPVTASYTFDTPYDSADVGFALCADYVVETRVERVDEKRISATAQLVCVLDGKSLWREKFEVNSGNIATIENSISEQVARALDLQPSKKWKQSAVCNVATSNAFKNFKLGRAFFAEGRFLRAIKCFDDTIESDKNYAPAYAAKADCYLWMGIYNANSPQQTFFQARDWANQALEKDPTLADAHTSLGYCNLFDWDWSGAESKFKLAIQLNRNCATAHQGYAHLLTALKRFAEASEQIECALEIDPFSPMVNLVKGYVLYYSGRYDESLEQFKDTVLLNRRSHAAYYSLALAFMQTGRFKEALEPVHKAIRYSHNHSQKRALQAYIHAMLGEKDEAQKELEKLNEEREYYYVPPFQVAAIYVALDEPDQAFLYLEESFKIKDQWLVLLRDDPRFIKLRADIRYKHLIQKLNFPLILK